MPLKYPWNERLGTLAIRSYPGAAHNFVSEWLGCCEWWIDTHAEESEACGWRPVHIMRPEKGVAWRWTRVGRPEIAFLPTAMMANFHDIPAQGSAGIIFAYRPESDGSVTMLRGREREACIGQLPHV